MGRLAVSLALLALAGVALSADPFCDDAYVFFPDGTRTPGTGNWESVGQFAAFRQGPCTGVSGISMTQTYLKNVLIIDRSASDDGHIMLDVAAGKKAYAQEINIFTNEMRPLDIVTNTFCSSAQHFPDGTIVNVGGDFSPDTDYVTPGGFSIRTYKPCLDGTCGFKVVAQTEKVRWYPTTQLLADGSMIIIGGATGALGINTPQTNVPFIEYYPKRAPVNLFKMDFLTETMPYNLFPFCHLLHTGNLFIFSGNKYILYDTKKNAVVPGARPPLLQKNENGALIVRQYPLSATSAMFPLRKAEGWLAEIMICGGSSTEAQTPAGDNPMAPADDKCWRIRPEAPAAKWVMHQMKLKRVMPIAVLLPDGHIFIHGGAMRGHTGFWNVAYNASLTPELYDTNTRNWSPLPMPSSKVPRGYHSSAQLLHDGAVMLSGSNTADGTVQGPIDFPTEFRVEYFDPPYRMPARLPLMPTLGFAPKNLVIGENFYVTFTYPPARPIKTVKVVLAHPGFSTHGANHGMRNVELPILRHTTVGAVHKLVVEGCPSNNVCPPTFYWLFVLVNGVPNGSYKDGFATFVGKK